MLIAREKLSDHVANGIRLNLIGWDFGGSFSDLSRCDLKQNQSIIVLTVTLNWKFFYSKIWDYF